MGIANCVSNVTHYHIAKYNDILLFYLILKEEFILSVSEKRVLRRIFGPKRDKVERGWRKLHKEGLRDLYSLPIIIGMMESMRMEWA
jgi:hypothetical protein